MKQKIAKLEALKENIYFRKYLQVPEDLSVKDVNFANRTASLTTDTRKTANELLELLQKGKALLFNNQLELKKWASSEHGATTAFIGQLEKLKAKFVDYENVCHTAKVISKKFTIPTLSDFERKKKRQRQKEQKSKTKKKCKTTKLRNAQELLHKKGVNEEEVEQICPTEYGAKSKRRIAPSQITANDAIKQRKTSLLYLKAIDAFDTEADIASGTSDSESSESDSSDN